MGPIQSSINTALGVAALASGLTNKKQVEKAQDKLDKSEENLAKTTAEKDEVIEQQVKDAEADIKLDEQLKKTYSKNLPTAKETNVDASDKIDVISNNSTNDINGPSINEFLNQQQKVDPYATEQIMGFHALKMLDSRIAAKKALIERHKKAVGRAITREFGGNK